MLLTDYERKQITGELQDITNELDIIDLLRKYFEHEYSIIFMKELEEKIKIANSRYNHFYNDLDDFDIRIYTLYQLKREIPAKLNIRTEYIRLKVLKVVIFFENILTHFDTGNERDINKNRKIEEGKNVYSFFRGLVANEICKISRFQKAIKILGFEKLSQDDFDNDKHRCMHDFIERLIIDYYLIPFIEEYKNYL